MREKYEAAKLLCEKGELMAYGGEMMTRSPTVLQLEPTNQFAAEYLPVIVERLQINTELSCDESDSDDHASSDDSHTSSNDGYHTHKDHTLHANKTTPITHTHSHHC